MLTTLLKSNHSLFGEIVSTMQTSLKVQRGDLEISFGLLADLENEELLTLLLEYTLSTQALGSATFELEKLDSLLGVVES